MLKNCLRLYVIIPLLLCACEQRAVESGSDQFLKISGVYPHLAIFNPADEQKEKCNGNGK